MQDHKIYYIRNDNPIISSYNEWLSLVNSISNSDNYVDAKVLVYPNPASKEVFVKLHDYYLDATDVSSVECELYDFTGAFLGTFISNHPAEIISIPTVDMNNGTYFIKCKIKSNNENLKDEVISLQFVIAK